MQIFRQKFGDKDTYDTEPRKQGPLGAAFPSLKFYLSELFGPVIWLGIKAYRGQCDDVNWIQASARFGDLLEEAGCCFQVSGMRNIDQVDEPCVFIANHMSTLETFILPAMIRPKKPVTFVVKKVLATMPFFGPIMRSRDPIVVGRVNPREDLTAVLDGGMQRLEQGISIVVFPQSTRKLYFEEEHFNSIGIKLARKANAPVIPIVLKTDAWGQGAKIKELGKIRPDLPIRFKFGEPIRIEGNGKKEHKQICDFISSQLAKWQAEDGVNE